MIADRSSAEACTYHTYCTFRNCGVNGLRRCWKGDDDTIYEWDYQHGRVEVYARNGVHIGEFDHIRVSILPLLIPSVQWSHDMATTYRLVGYDRMTDDMVASHPIPFRMVDYVRDRAGVLGRTDIVGDWPLDEIQARSIAWLIDVDIDQQLTLAWFLEPHESSVAA